MTNSIFMHFSVSAFFVKMCLERPAGRDKHENKDNISAKYAQSEVEGIPNRPTTLQFSSFYPHVI